MHDMLLCCGEMFHCKQTDTGVCLLQKGYWYSDVLLLLNLFSFPFPRKEQSVFHRNFSLGLNKC